MKKLSKIAAAALLMIALCTSATAQSLPTSTPASTSTAATSSAPGQAREQVIARLINEVKANRELLAAQRARITALEEQVAVEQKNSASLSESYRLAQGEITQLRTSIGYLEKAIELHEQTVKILQDQNGVLAKKLKKSRKQTAVAGAVAVILTVLRFAF